MQNNAKINPLFYDLRIEYDFINVIKEDVLFTSKNACMRDCQHK